MKAAERKQSGRRDARPGCDSILAELAARPMLGAPALSLQQLLDVHYCASVRLRAPLPPRVEAALAAELSRAGALRALPPRHLVYAVSFRLRQAEKRMGPGVRLVLYTLKPCVFAMSIGYHRQGSAWAPGCV